MRADDVRSRPAASAGAGHPDPTAVRPATPPLTGVQALGPARRVGVARRTSLWDGVPAGFRSRAVWRRRVRALLLQLLTGADRGATPASHSRVRSGGDRARTAGKRAPRLDAAARDAESTRRQTAHRPHQVFPIQR